MKKFKIIALSALAMVLLAADTPKKDDLIELTSWLNGRSDAKFRSSDNNRIFTLKPGTRGSVEEVKHFPQTNNYGVCLKVMNVESLDNSQRCIWVYYNPKRPNMNLYTVGGKTVEREARLAAWSANPKKVTATKVGNDPRGADAAEVIRATAGVPDFTLPPPMETQPATTGADAAKPVDATLPAENAIRSLDQLNQNAPAGRDPVDPNSSCPDGKCAPTVNSYQACTSGNNYLEQALVDASQKNPLQAVLQTSKDAMIKESCIKTSLETFPNSSNYYRSCGPLIFTKKSPRPCISETYVNVTAKSFNLVASCMSDLLAGSSNPKETKDAAYSVFSLMTHESGMHINAKSFSGAGGPSQLTGTAIRHINSMMSLFREHLAKSSNPTCSGNLASAIANPMGSVNYCNRIKIDEDNPLKNIFYGFAYQYAMRQNVENRFFEVPRYQKLFSQLSAPDLDRLKRSLAMWAHNTGPGGINTPTEALLTEMLRKNVTLKSSQDVDKFLGSLKEFMQAVPHQSNSSPARRRETANYYNHIVERVAKIEPEANSCIAP